METAKEVRTMRAFIETYVYTLWRQRMFMLTVINADPLGIFIRTSIIYARICNVVKTSVDTDTKSW